MFDMKTRNLVVVCITIFVILLLIGILFWPTLYRYEKLMVDDKTPVLVRTNRLTKYTEKYNIANGKWVSTVKYQRKSSVNVQELLYEERARITGYARLLYGSFSVDVYNGSDLTIKKLRFRIIAKEKNGSVRWDREFDSDTFISPLSTGICYFFVGDTDIIGSQCDWYINKVWGYKEWSVYNLSMLQDIVRAELTSKRMVLLQKEFENNDDAILEAFIRFLPCGEQIVIKNLAVEYGVGSVLDKIFEQYDKDSR